MNLYEADEKLHSLDLTNAEHRVLSIVKYYVNKKHWKPAAIRESVFERVMSKPTFLVARKHLVESGHLAVVKGKWTTDTPIYDLFPNQQTEIAVRTDDEIKEIVKEIDKNYPDFSGYCAKYSWDIAIKKFKAAHPDLGVWGVDSIGDPENRLFAHGRFVWLHNRKMEKATGAEPNLPKPAKPVSVWDDFYIYVDMWRLTYPKKANRALIMKAVKDFTMGKEQWSSEQIKALQDTITNHTTAYIASFSGDYTYMVSPVNYIAADKWTERVSVKHDKTDVHQKRAGAHAVPNMPKVTTIKVN